MSEILLKLSGAVEMRWIDTYFPFTNPSFELEIYFQVCHFLGIYVFFSSSFFLPFFKIIPPILKNFAPLVLPLPSVWSL
jgi:hypothetical protein